tara:strand:- start:682 stop:885 length:204 start_codon:yes stop_codon:yes gene_type:complete
MSETDWHKIHSKLQGRCIICSKVLPKHAFGCPIPEQEFLEKLEKIDNSVKHISDITEVLIKKLKNYV